MVSSAILHNPHLADKCMGEFGRQASKEEKDSSCNLRSGFKAYSKPCDARISGLLHGLRLWMCDKGLRVIQQATQHRSKVVGCHCLLLFTQQESWHQNSSAAEASRASPIIVAHDADHARSVMRRLGNNRLIEIISGSHSA